MDAPSESSIENSSVRLRAIHISSLKIILETCPLAERVSTWLSAYIKKLQSLDMQNWSLSTETITIGNPGCMQIVFGFHQADEATRTLADGSQWVLITPKLEISFPSHSLKPAEIPEFKRTLEAAETFVECFAGYDTTELYQCILPAKDAAELARRKKLTEQRKIAEAAFRSKYSGVKLGTEKTHRLTISEMKKFGKFAEDTLCGDEWTVRIGNDTLAYTLHPAGETVYISCSRK